MSSSAYGAIGTNPLSDLESSIEHLLAQFLKDHYDQTITGVPVDKILWERYFTGSTGDYGLYFEENLDNDTSSEVSGMLMDYDHVTSIHVFAKSTHDDWERSADKKLFDFNRWIKKTINENKTGLVDKGIQAMYYVNARTIPSYDDKADIKRKIISVWFRYSIIQS